MTINWTGPNRGKLRRTLLTFYPDVRRLKRFVSDRFDHTLTDLSETTPEDWAEDLIEKARSEGWINQLYQEFWSAHPDDFRVIDLRSELMDPALEAPIGDSSQDAGTVQRSQAEDVSEEADDLLEDPQSTHLVVAVFWQQRTGNKLRVQPKLCYRDVSTREIYQQPLIEDNCTVSLEKFPEFLKQLVDFTYSKVAHLFSVSSQPWTLTIELFVPVDLLCQPLSIWCGSGNLLSNRPIVMGCSDRFNADLEGDAIDLHNKLTLGWQRFQEKVPDKKGSNLQNLAWLTSQAAGTTAFGDYSGFQCYGHWLKSGKAALQNWQELVRSGIPLALWMCESIPAQCDVISAFNELTDSNRFEFLERVRLKRDEQRKTCDYYVGVLYEDPSYVPDVPLPPEEQSFVWPGT